MSARRAGTACALLCLGLGSGCGGEPAPAAAGAAAGRDDLYAVAIDAAGRVVAVGEGGSVLRSDDAGESWTAGRADAAALYSVSLADAGHGFAVGRFGAILATRDAGASWQAQPNPSAGEGRHLLAVHALDRARALAVGSFGTRLRTEDGGRRWLDASLVDADGGAADVVLQDVSCRSDGAACWVVGEFGTILQSGDAGRSWRRDAIAAEVETLTLAFTPGSDELGPEAGSRLAAFAAALAGGAPTLAIESFASRAEIEAGRGDPEPLVERLAARADAARRVLAAAGVPSDRLREVDPAPWEAEGPGPLADYLARRRADRAQVVVSVRDEPVLFSVRSDGASGGWIAGLGGLVLHNADGGRLWRPFATASGAALFAIAPAAARRVAATEIGLVELGEAGARPLAATPGFLRDVRFAPSDPALGFAVGQAGRIFRTRDAGASWHPVWPPD